MGENEAKTQEIANQVGDAAKDISKLWAQMFAHDKHIAHLNHLLHRVKETDQIRGAQFIVLEKAFDGSKKKIVDLEMQVKALKTGQFALGEDAKKKRDQLRTQGGEILDLEKVLRRQKWLLLALGLITLIDTLVIFL